MQHFHLYLYFLLLILKYIINILTKEINLIRNTNSKMKETINIDESIWEKAKIEAEKRGITTDEIVKQALEIFLGRDTKKISLNND